jgi:hypothetical protein
MQKVGFAAPTRTMTPHIKKKKNAQKNLNPPTADFHLKKEEKRKKRKKEEKKKKKKEKEEKKEEKEKDVGL